MKSFILASSSPRRQELLLAAGYQFTVKPANINEDIIPGEAPLTYVSRLAKDKAAAIKDNSIILAADTIVFMDDTIFGKPSGSEEAIEMLSFLSGKTHQVATSFCLKSELKQQVQTVTSEVSFRTLSLSEIKRYVLLGESLDKAGAYAIQGFGGFLVSQIHGSFTNIVGLPLAEVLSALKNLETESSADEKPV